jgi:hypothetical protein
MREAAVYRSQGGRVGAVGAVRLRRGDVPQHSLRPTVLTKFLAY